MSDLIIPKSSLRVIQSQHLRHPDFVPRSRRYERRLSRAAARSTNMPEYFDGPDLSKYQGASAMAGYDFCYENIEDPNRASKFDFAAANGIPISPYKWCFPGQSGAQMLEVAKRNTDPLLRPGMINPIYILDYEEAGVAPWQITGWFEACDRAGVRKGLYTYLYMMNAQGFGFQVRPDIFNIIAYYPGNNSGVYYPSMSDEALRRGADGHQYTSSGGRLDLNRFFDATKFIGGAYAPPAPPGPLIDFDTVFTNIRAAEGENNVATARFLEHDVTFTVDDAGNLRMASRGAMGVWDPRDEVIIEGLCNPSVQPSVAVHGDLVAAYVQLRDGHVVGVTWDPTNGWRDTDAHQFTPPARG